MDYSILMARIKSNSPIHGPNVFQERFNNEVYWVFRIIDFLQKYTMTKRLESGVKKLTVCGTRKISSINSSTYGDRLIRSVKQIIA